MIKSRLVWLLAAASALAAACGPVLTDTDAGEPVAQVAQAAICLDCDPGEPPPPPPPPPPDLCGGNTYTVPATTQPFPTNWDKDFRDAHDYARRSGYVDGFKNFHAAVYSYGEVQGTFLVRPEASYEFRDVPVSELNNVALNDVPGMMRAAHSYALRNGFTGAIPTFHAATNSSGVVVRGVYLFRSASVEYRDVPACELGFPNSSDVGQMFRGVNDYKVRTGYSAGFPTFGRKTASDGNTLYGVILFRPGMADWRDVRTSDFNTSCGGDNQSACGSQCDTNAPYYYWDRCHSAPMPACGAENQICCNGSCNSGLTCQSGYCKPPPPPPCGGENEACCSNTTCNSGLVCVSSTSGNLCKTSSGTEYLGMSKTGTCADYITSVSNPTPMGFESTKALVTTVTNTTGVQIRVRHAPTAGPYYEQILNPGQMTDWSSLNMTYSGDWSATAAYACIDAPSGITIQVGWRRP